MTEQDRVRESVEIMTELYSCALDDSVASSYMVNGSGYGVDQAEQAILALMDKRFEELLKLIELLQINACDLSREGLPPFHIDIIHWMTKIFEKKDEIRERWKGEK